jgi:hypothetical protein
MPVCEMIEDSESRAARWDRENRSRAIEINNEFDRLESIFARREYYSTLTPEEQNGSIEELIRRKVNREVPIGTFVKITRNSIYDLRISRTLKLDPKTYGIGIVIAQRDHCRTVFLSKSIPCHDGFSTRFIITTMDNLKGIDDIR